MVYFDGKFGKSWVISSILSNIPQGALLLFFRTISLSGSARLPKAAQPRRFQHHLHSSCDAVPGRASVDVVSVLSGRLLPRPAWLGCLALFSPKAAYLSKASPTRPSWESTALTRLRRLAAIWCTRELLSLKHPRSRTQQLSVVIESVLRLAPGAPINSAENFGFQTKSKRKAKTKWIFSGSGRFQSPA